MLTAAVGIFLILLPLTRCGRHEPQRIEQAAEPSRLIEQHIEADGSETATYTVMLAEREGAIERLRADSSRMAQRLAAILASTKHVTTATAFSTATPCGDTLEQAVVLREQRAGGVFGFLKPRDVLVDVKQLTPGARTLALQSFALPAPRPRKWGIGVFAGYGVGPNLQPEPMVGVGLSYNLIRF